MNSIRMLLIPRWISPSFCHQSQGHDKSRLNSSKMLTVFCFHFRYRGQYYETLIFFLFSGFKIKDDQIFNHTKHSDCKSITSLM